MSSTRASVMPEASALWEEAWIAGPSAIGSENGMPSSIRSAPALGSCSRMAKLVSASGSPAVMNGTNAARPARVSSAKRPAIRLTTGSLSSPKGTAHVLCFPPPAWGGGFATGSGANRRGETGYTARLPPPPRFARHLPHDGVGNLNSCRVAPNSYALAHRFSDGEDILVAAAGERHDDDGILRHSRRDARDMGERMCRFERRNDPLLARQCRKRVECFAIGGGEIFHPALILEPGMFGTDARIVEASRYRMRFHNLALRCLQQIGAGAVQHAGETFAQRRRVARSFRSGAGRLDAVDLDGIVVKKGMKQTDRIRAPAHAGDEKIRQTLLRFENLRPRLLADNGLKIAHHCRGGTRAGHRTDYVERAVNVGDPVAQRFVHPVLERLRARRDLADFRAQK